MKIDKALQSAVTYHRRGDLKQAEALYKKVLKKQPTNIDALHFLGMICCQLGDYDDAIRYIKKEIEITPSNADAYYKLGTVLQAKGLFSESIDYFRKAITLNPRFPEAYYNLGFAFQNTGQLDEAIIHYQKAIQIEPRLVEAYNNLGILLRVKGHLEESITYFQKALQINPDYANIYNNLGLSLQDKGNIDEAIVHYQKAINLNPAFADAYYNLGIALQSKKQLDNAIMCYQKAIELNPVHVDAYNNLGATLKDKGQSNDAITCYKKALEINPYNAEVHFNLALAYLLSGNFKEGWKEYNWRWRTIDFIPKQRNFSKPVWDGSDITGRTILLHTEQGFGDAIQFIRYVPLVVKRGAKVIIECQKELISLFQNVEGIHQIIAWSEQLPSFDLHCPLMSLPLVFETTLDTIPAEIPYIKVNTALLQKWKDKVKDDNSKLKVGLSWAGSPTHKNDLNRSFPLETLAPLAQLDGVIFYSLQKWEAAEQAKNPPEGMRLVDYTNEINDFSDTTALIENLDLVISVDTVVAHLAGAMGKPVWILLPFAPDWRWMLNHEDSLWYPTMRLFRQPSPGDWESVINNVLRNLELFIRDENR